VTRYFDLVPGYESLATVYDSAIEQASEGKGRERHANEGEAYENQIICEVARRVGLGYPLGQAVKKIYESQRIGGERGVAELLGALNYVAAAVIVMREGMETVPEANHPENPDSSTAVQTKFKHGDSLLVTMPDGEDIRCIYVGESTHPGCCCVRYLGGDFSGDTDDTVPIDQLRRVPAPKAEGCEALVEHDAPQSPEEVCRHIVDCNPATYGSSHKPTGEELAEMAEEDEKHE
jgi:hypothetical protein